MLAGVDEAAALPESIEAAVRTRSEYRLGLASDEKPDEPASTSSAVELPFDFRHAARSDRVGCATLLLDAYRGTIDDEGEDANDALAAIDDYFERILWDHCFVASDRGVLAAMSFVVVVGDMFYIDPVATAQSHKRLGLARIAIMMSLASLVANGVTEVGATITDGNTASERLFIGTGFERIGPYPPT